MMTIDKVYIDGPYGSKTLNGVLLARFERVSHVTHFYNDTIPIYDPSKSLQHEWAQEFPDYKTCLANNLSIDLRISNSHDPSMYTLSMAMTDMGI